LKKGHQSAWPIMQTIPWPLATPKTANINLVKLKLNAKISYAYTISPVAKTYVINIEAETITRI